MFTDIRDVLIMFAQNIDCGYTLEPPRRGGIGQKKSNVRQAGKKLLQKYSKTFFFFSNLD